MYLRRILSLGTLIIALTGLSMTVVAQDSDAEIEELFTKAAELFQRGRTEDSAAALEKVLAMRPDSDLALHMRDQVKYDVLVMMLEDLKTREAIQELMELAVKETIRRRVEPEKVRALVTEFLETKDYKTRVRLELELTSTGETAVPFLIRNLADEVNDDPRIRTMLVIRNMGSRAVLPLVEGLNSDSDFMKQNIAILLGDIGDQRAVPSLKMVYENPGVAPEVKPYISDAIQKITGSGPDSLSSAAELFYQYALDYYYRRDSVRRRIITPELLIWDWSEEKNGLVHRSVPSYLYYAEMSEEACYDAIALDSGLDGVYSLLACAHYTQLSELEARLKIGALYKKFSQAEMDGMAKLKDELDEVELLARPSGQINLYHALARALNDDDPLVAIHIIHALRNVASGGLLPPAALMSREEGAGPANPRYPGSAIVDAINSPNGRVRAAAAAAIVHMRPRDNFLDSGKVVRILADTVRKTGTRAILVVDRDQQVINYLKGTLRELGYIVVDAKDPSLAVQKAVSNVDLVLLTDELSDASSRDDELKHPSSRRFVRILAQDYRTEFVPVLIITGKEDLDEVSRQFQEKIAGVIPKGLEKAELAEKVAAALENERATSDAKAEAHADAVMAAEALAAIGSGHAIFDMRPAEEALVQSFADVTDDVRLPCIIAASNVGSTDITPRFVKLFVNKDNETPIRLNALWSMARNLHLAPSELSGDDFAILLEGLKEDDPEMRKAAAAVIGSAQLTPVQFVAVLKAQRIQFPVLDKVPEGALKAADVGISREEL